jgi:putative CocE/NonD family hydrolase
MNRETTAPATESISEIEHCWVPMADGVRLAARLWLPRTLPAPAIVEYIPYRKRDMVRARDERNHPWFAARGYACIRVDMRGSGDSEGAMRDMYTDDELGDALGVLEWIAEQDWCDGAVGMMGTSWGGTSALQAAASGSGLLRAAIAVCATNDRYNDDIHHMGGCLLTDSIEWGATLPAILALPPSAESDPEGWRETWRTRLEQMEFPLFSWIEHETRDAYWRHGSVSENPQSFDCPVLAIGGWSDRYSNTVMNLLADNPHNCWGIVGPWGHHYPDQGVPGPAIGFQQEALRWWDRWLRARDNGVDGVPRLRVWCGEYQQPQDYSAMRRGRWLALSDWAGAQAAQKYAESALALLPAPNAEERQSHLVRVPCDLRVGGAAGDTGYFGRPGGLPTEQSTDDANSLVFDSETLQSDQVLLGKALVGLDLQVDRLPAQIIVRLGDVAPDGQVMRVAYRVHNLALEQNYLPSATGSGQDLRHLDLALPNAAHLFAAGHRIRIALSASYWPMIWPAAEPSEILIGGEGLQLRLALAPVDAQVVAQAEFAEPLAPVVRDAALVEEKIQREVARGDASGELLYRWRQPLSMTRHEAVNLAIGAETSAEHRIDINDPLSAQSQFEHRLLAVYAESRIEARGMARVAAGRDHYRVEGSLQVFEDDREIFARDWSRGIARKHA